MRFLHGSVSRMSLKGTAHIESHVLCRWSGKKIIREAGGLELNSNGPQGLVGKPGIKGFPNWD